MRPRTAKCHRVTAAALAASALLALPAHAVDFNWTSGTFVPGTTAPSPLTAPDTLTLDAASTKTFNAVSFTNDSTVNWLATSGSIGFSNGAMVVNSGLWDAQGNANLTFTGGAITSFTNSGTLRKSGGTGTTTLGGNGFGYTQTGTIDAQTGTVRLTAGPIAINAGSVFTGAGVVEMANSATFSGSFTSGNLRLTGGTQTGDSAVLNGLVRFDAGTLAGTWQVASGQTLALSNAATKTINGSGTLITNSGTVTQLATSGNISFSNAAAVNNNGVWDFQNDSGLTFTGGGATSFNNVGTLLKTGGTGTTTVGGGGFGYTQTGTVNAQTGTVRFTAGPIAINTGSVFTGAGTVEMASSATFSGSFTSSNLHLTGGTQTGDSAVLNGLVRFDAGTLAGTWLVASGQALTLAGAATKTINGTDTLITNSGSVTQLASSGNISFSNAAAVDNNGVWDIQGNSGLVFVGGGGTSFNNAGTLRKSGGSGTTTVGGGGLGYTQSGTIDVQTGTVRLTAGPIAINAGSVFTGAGVVEMANGANFSGSFSSSNLHLTGGTQAGSAAVINGVVSFDAGTLSGTWEVANGQTLNLATASTKTINTAGTVVTNNGTVNQLASSGNISFANGATVVNNGTWDIQNNSGLVFIGGSATSFTNTGLLVKSAGTGTTGLNGSNLGFSNNAGGTVDVQTGTIALPSSFTNDGKLTGDGIFSAAGTGITNNGSVAPGSFGVGELTIAGDFSQTALGMLEIDITSLASFDLLTISGDAALAGQLALFCLADCSFNVGDSLTILTASTGVTGSFSPTLQLVGFDSGAFDVVYNTNSVQLLVTENVVAAIPEPHTWALLLAGITVLSWRARQTGRR